MNIKEDVKLTRKIPLPMTAISDDVLIKMAAKYSMKLKPRHIFELQQKNVQRSTFY